MTTRVRRYLRGGPSTSRPHFFNAITVDTVEQGIQTIDQMVSDTDVPVSDVSPGFCSPDGDSLLTSADNTGIKTKWSGGGGCSGAS